MTADAQVVAHLRAKLLSPSTPLPQKYRALFSLRALAGAGATDALQAVLLAGGGGSSALLRHEAAYCLGQRQDPSAVAVLARVLADASEHPMVRHEAGEALGAIGTDDCVAPLRGHAGDAAREVAETCRLALDRIEGERRAAEDEKGSDANWGCGVACDSPYLSVDPARAAPSSASTAELEAALLDEQAGMAERYAAMFALRNRGGPGAVAGLCRAFASGSALLRHEVAYVLGQMRDPSAIETLARVLRDGREAAMVRHEAAEALGAIGEAGCIELLREGAGDAEPIVAQSCEVALDMLAHEASGEFQYADMAEGVGQEALVR
eukprot:evm.model.scf_301.1 EVM.evm.TU.scf_301.1   scf_301:5341-6309(+)